MVSMGDLREAGAKAALGGIASQLAAVKRQVAHAAEVERLGVQLMSVSKPHRLEAILGEAKRREQVMSDIAASTEERILDGPEVAALRSVLEDVLYGRLA